MKLHHEITENTRFIQMNVNDIQALIKQNKVLIRNLQAEADYCKYLISEKYWPNSNPRDFGVISQSNYEMLNQVKSDLRVINKKIKLLSNVQYSLKASIR